MLVHLGDEEGFLTFDHSDVAVHVVQILVVSAEIATLREAFVAQLTFERPG